MCVSVMTSHLRRNWCPASCEVQPVSLISSSNGQGVPRKKRPKKTARTKEMAEEEEETGED